MKRTERNNLNTAKLNRRATIGKSREVDHRQTKRSGETERGARNQEVKGKNPESDNPGE